MFSGLSTTSSAPADTGLSAPLQLSALLATFLEVKKMNIATLWEFAGNAQLVSEGMRQLLSRDDPTGLYGCM